MVLVPKGKRPHTEENPSQASAPPQVSNSEACPYTCRDWLAAEILCAAAAGEASAGQLAPALESFLLSCHEAAASADRDQSPTARDESALLGNVLARLAKFFQTQSLLDHAFQMSLQCWMAFRKQITVPPFGLSGRN